jgi:hypothetical protein
MVDFPALLQIPSFRNEKAISKKHMFRIFGKRALLAKQPILSAKGV